MPDHRLTAPAALLAVLELAAAPRVVTGDGRAVALAPLDAALLAWLALEGPTPRARLAPLLWPDKDGEAARNSLRQRLFQLRRQLGIEIVAGGASLALAGGVAHDLDAADTVLAPVGEAQLPGEFAQWLGMQRARRLGRVREARVARAERAESAGDWAAALTQAHELLALEPLSEAAHRRVMRLHYLAGDRAAALQAFDRCEQRLKDELGARPSAETLALLATIDAAVPAAPAPGFGELPASVLRPPRLVGRDAERAALQRGWAAGRVVAVIGEAGLGKSRLLQEFAAARAGVVRAAGRPGDAGVPFATLARLLRAVAAGTGVDRAALPAAGGRGEIARVLPELGAGAPPAGEGQRLVLLRAVRDWIGGRAALAGLIVDDLHFADEASLDMLQSLADADADADADAAHADADAGAGADAAPPLRWAFAWRPAEAGSPLQALHDGLVEQARLDPVLLSPLDEAALAALVDSLGLPGVDGRTLAPGLHRRTGGNPLFVLETIKQAWAERTLAQLADARALPRPLSVGRLIQRRLAQLSPAALAIARVASIAGVDFGVALAEQVLGVSAMQFADAFHELEAAQVLRGEAFAHDLVFEAVRESVPAAIATHTHAQVARWLEAHGGEPARIARHWIDGGQGVAALPWLAKAAEAARRALRAKEAIGFLEAKSSIEQAAGQAEASFASLLAAAELFMDSDRDPARSLDYCDRLDARAATPRQRVDALLQRAHLHQQRAEFEPASAAAQAALPQAEALGDPALAALAHREVGLALARAQRRSGEAERHLRLACDWYERHGSDEERGQVHAELAVLYDNSGRLDESAPHHELAFELACRAGNLSDASVICGNLACSRIDAGDLEAADRRLRQGQQLIAAGDEFGADRGMLHLMRALVLAHLGRYAAALSHAELGLDAVQRLQPGLAGFAELRLAWVWWHLGQRARVAAALARVPVGGDTPLSTRTMHARLAWRAAQAGGRGDAIAGTREALAALAALKAEIGDERADLSLPLRIDLAAGLAPAAAIVELEAVLASARRCGHAGAALAAEIRLAGAAAAVDPAAAARHAEAALARAAQGRQTTALLPAELWLQAGRAFAAQGDAARAARTFASGRDWIDDTAGREVPAPFRAGFLERNPVHRALLAEAARVAGA